MLQDLHKGKAPGENVDAARGIIERRREGEVELAEMRHRFANAFQLLSSLIRIRMAHTAHEETRRHLNWLVDAVSAIARLYGHLNSPDGTNFSVYLEKLPDLWRPLCGTHNVEITVDANAEIDVHESKLVSLSLIAHELITNCCQHAFPNKGGGRISVRLTQGEDGWCELVVADDGVGFPQGQPDMASHGLSLITKLTALIGGKFALESEGGVVARVRFLPSS